MRDDARSVNALDGDRRGCACASDAGINGCERVTIEASLRPLLRVPRRANRCCCSRKHFAGIGIDNKYVIMTDIDTMGCIYLCPGYINEVRF